VLKLFNTDIKSKYFEPVNITVEGGGYYYLAVDEDKKGMEM